MSNSPMPWVKIYREIIDDPKLGRLDDACRWRYVCLIILAGECDAEGYLVAGETAMTTDDIAWRLRAAPKAVARDLASLEAVGVVDHGEKGWRVTKFSERQGRAQNEKRSSWRERKQKERAKSGGPELEKGNEAPDVAGSEKDVTQVSRVTVSDVTQGVTPLEESREEKRTHDGRAKSARRSADKSPDRGEKPSRQRDELYDAIAEVCRVDPATAGPSIGKVRATLAGADPPYTAAEVRRFGELWWEWTERKDPPTVWRLQERIGKVRENGHQVAPAVKDGDGGIYV